MSNKENLFVPVVVEDYYPKVTGRLLNRILKVTPKNVVLFGFSDNMKWLLRLLQENSITPILTDWREKYSNYDCGGHQMISVEELEDTEDTLIDIAGYIILLMIAKDNESNDIQKRIREGSTPPHTAAYSAEEDTVGEVWFSHQSST